MQHRGSFTVLFTFRIPPPGSTVTKRCHPHQSGGLDSQGSDSGLIITIMKVRYIAVICCYNFAPLNAPQRRYVDVLLSVRGRSQTKDCGGPSKASHPPGCTHAISPRFRDSRDAGPKTISARSISPPSRRVAENHNQHSHLFTYRNPRIKLHASPPRILVDCLL